jgi:hypothetical protein
MTKTVQVANAMRRLIADGHWTIDQSVGDLGKLEAESEQLFGVRASFGTIRAAEQILVDEGILYPIQPGVPTRVRAVPGRGDENPTLAELRVAYNRLSEAHARVGELIAALS